MFVFSGYVGGLWIASRVSARVVNRIAAQSSAVYPVLRGGRIATIIAVVPALVIATIIGGNVGGLIAATWIETLTNEISIRQAAVGAGIGIGVAVILVLLIGSLAGAGATFLKVWVAREENRHD